MKTLTKNDTQNLGSALELANGQVLKNRIAKSATSEALADRNTGRPSEELMRLYEVWARGGAGMLITGNVVIDMEGRTEPGNVVIEDDRHLPELTQWASRTRAAGARIWMQINHAGRQSTLRITNRPIAPSATPMKGMPGLFARPQELTDEQIRGLIERYANAAALAEQAGFDGVQIHAAHGYLVSQFLSPLVNKREDRWGGTPEKRMAFLIEIIRAVRARLKPETGIAVKLNSADFQRGGFSEEESMDVVRALEAEGIHFLEISGGSYESSAMMGSGKTQRESTRSREAYFLEYAKKVRDITRLPLMLTGGMRTAATMEHVVTEGVIDIIGMARPMIVEPDLPGKLLTGAQDGSRMSPPRMGLKLLDDMLQIVWYQEQLHVIARTGYAKANLNKWQALGAGFFKSYASNPLKRVFGSRRPKEFHA